MPLDDKPKAKSDYETLCRQRFADSAFDLNLNGNNQLLYQTKLLPQIIIRQYLRQDL